MIRDLRIAVIGAGVMGEAMIGGLLKQELVAPEQIIATEPREGRRTEIAQRYGVRVTDDNVEAAHWAQVAIFSVKPQTLPKVLPELRGALKHGELVISIVAGAPIRHFVEPGPQRDRPLDAEHSGADRRGHDRLDRGRGRQRAAARLGAHHPWLVRPRAVCGRRELPGYGHGAQRHRPGVCLYGAGGDDRRRRAPGPAALYGRGAGASDNARLGALRHAEPTGTPPSCATV